MTNLVLAAMLSTQAQASDLHPTFDLEPPPVVEVPYTQASNTTTKSKRRLPLLAAAFNFFLPGTGYLYNGEKPLYVSLPMIGGALGLTYVEQIHQFEDGGTLQDQDSTAFAVMFGAVLLLNTGAAIDAFREAQTINRTSGTAKKKDGKRMAFSPAAFQVEDGTSYGLSLGGTY